MIASALLLDAGRSRRADSTRLGIRMLVTAFCFLAILSSSHALQCTCNDANPWNDCIYNGWTCTVSDSVGVCIARIRVLEDGTIHRETKCMRTDLNPLHCSGGYNTDTDVFECCSGDDFCNDNLSPTLPPQSSPSPSVRTPQSSPSPSVRTPQSSSSSKHPVSSSLAISVVPSASASSSIATPLPTPADMLRCECSKSLCLGRSSCETNYKCFRDVRYHKTAKYVETRLGCLESITEVNLDGIGVCKGRLNTADYKLECCDDKEFCNRELSVALDPEGPTDSFTTSPESESGDDRLYLILAIVVVIFTMVTGIVILVVLSILCLRYQREKAKVTSVDHFQTDKNHLSRSAPTYMVDTVLHLHTSRKDYVAEHTTV